MTAAVLVGFVLGFCAGVSVFWGRLRVLRAKVKLYETYIQERLGKQVADQRKMANGSADTGDAQEDLTSFETRG